MPTSIPNMASPSTDSFDPLAGVDHIIVIDNGAHNIRIASIPYPFSPDSISAAAAAAASSSTSHPVIDPSILAQSIQIDVFPNAIARTRTPHTIPPSSAFTTAPPPGTKTSIFVSSHIHTLLDDYAALHLRLPHQSGIVVDWSAQKTIWDHVLTNHLGKLGGNKKGGKLLSGKAVVLTEAYFNLEGSQAAMDLLMFEQYGAQAVWRCGAAGLVGLGTELFRSDESIASDQGNEDDAETASQGADASASSAAATKRPHRAPRTSTSTTATTTDPSIPRLLSIPRPQAMLVLDLGYSYCHAIPIVNSQPHTPSIRRLELGGKMLINLLKETLSFQQLDMMDESWLMSYIFAKTVFVAPEVGQRVVVTKENERRVLEDVRRKRAGEWSYEDLLMMCKWERGGRIGVTWSLPDYGGGGGMGEGRDRARYGYVLEGPKIDEIRQDDTPSSRKRAKLDLIDYGSSFIASSPSSKSTKPTTTSAPSSPSSDEDPADLQTLHLTNERFSITEHLFNPLSLNLDQQPLPELVLDSITSLSRSSLPQAKAAADMMWSNIVLIGGLANTVGMKQRLEHELRALAPDDVRVKIWKSGKEDGSLAAVKSAVVMACEMSAEEAVRRGGGEGEGGGAGGRKKGRKSQVAVKDGKMERGTGGKGRWLTYGQWMNPEGGAGGGEGEIVRAANRVFYPPMQKVADDG